MTNPSRTVVDGQRQNAEEGTGGSLSGAHSSEGSPSLVCPCCAGREFKTIVRQIRSIYSTKPYDVVRCQGCGHGMTEPMPSPAELQAIYDRIYSYDVNYAVIDERAYRARFLADKIVRLRPPSGTFRALEIGCMFGTLVKELTARGIATKGIELSKESADFCRAAGLDVTCESVEQFVSRASDERFDVIVLSHVLEHIMDPRAIIEQLAGMLNVNGHLLVCVPNYECWHAKLFGANWGWWQVPVHIHHFCESSLRRLMESLGFDDFSTELRGGDSLIILLTLMNMLGANKVASSGVLSPSKRIAVKAFSKVMRGYTRVGGDDLQIVCRLKSARPAR
jgi:SAM-dependent methyltransferase